MAPKIKIQPTGNIDNIEKPVKANNSLPEWYSNITNEPKCLNGNIRSCIPFFRAMSEGLVFTSPCDITVNINNTETPEINQKEDVVTNFSKSMAGKENDKNILKIMSGWEFQKSLDGYYVYVSNPLNSRSNVFEKTSGILDGDKYSGSINLITFLKENVKTVEIDKGEELIQIIPIKKDTLENLDYEIVSDVNKGLK
jgi:hypothetical protein